MKTSSFHRPITSALLRRAAGSAFLGLLLAPGLHAQVQPPTPRDAPHAMSAEDASRSAHAEAARAQMEAELRASRIVHHAPGNLPPLRTPLFQGVDVAKLLVVVETGEPQLTVLDGDRLQPIQRLPMRPGLQGEPQFTPDGRYVFVLTRDGWLSKFDLWHLALVAEIRVGTQTRNIALSGNGRFLAVANEAPHSLVMLDTDLQLLKLHAVRNKDRSRSSRVLAVHDAPSRESFVAVLQDVPEVWEISYDPKADDVPIGVIHDFLYKEGAFIPGFLNPRRSYLAEPIKDFVMLPGDDELLAIGRDSGQGLLLHLDVRKPIATPKLDESPRLNGSVGWRTPTPGEARAPLRLALPSARGEHRVTIVDAERWRPVRTVATNGPVTFLGSHERTPFLWIATQSSTAQGCLQLVDKQSLAVTASLPIPCSPAPVHVGFSRDGRYALVSLQGRKDEGDALVVLDAVQHKTLTRIPMNQPVATHRVGSHLTGPGPAKR